jgi:hypothetical protein
MRTRILAAAAAVASTVALASIVEPLGAQPSPDPLPPQLADYVTKHVKLSAEQRAQLTQGTPVTKLLDADASREVAVFGAVWIEAPVARYIEAYKDIEQFEKGGNFLVTKKVSTPPRLDDFAPLKVPPDDIADLRRCKVDSCKLKLGEAALERMRKEVDWSKPTAQADVERLARQLALEYVTSYLEGGNRELAIYRDSDRPTFVAQEFSSMIDRLPEFTEYLPDLKRYLLDFPKATLPNSESFVYWQEAKFGLKPTVRINHVAIVQEPRHVAIVSKMLYASHYFWSALELRVLVPDAARGEGFWFASVNRSRSDGLSGFTGSMIRGKVRGEAEKGMEAALKITKTKMERPGS